MAGSRDRGEAKDWARRAGESAGGEGQARGARQIAITRSMTRRLWRGRARVSRRAPAPSAKKKSFVGVFITAERIGKQAQEEKARRGPP